MKISKQNSRDVKSSVDYLLDESSNSEEVNSHSANLYYPSAIHPNMKRSQPWFSDVKGYPRKILNSDPLSAKPPSERRGLDINGVETSISHRTCNCKRSNCLKLYCDCFASGEYCKNCNCTSCCNNPEKETLRSSAIRAIIERNPSAFRPKIDSGNPSPALQDSDFSSQKKHNKVKCL